MFDCSIKSILYRLGSWALFAPLFIGASPPSLAQEYPYQYQSAHFLGRGHTGIAIADDENAIFYNPAGLARGDGIYKKTVLASPMLEFSQSARDVIKQVALQESDPTETLRKQVGAAQHVGFNQFSGIILRRAALGAFVHSSTTLLLYKDAKKGALESILAQSVNDIGLTFSLAHNVFSKNYHVGLTAKHFKRAQAAFSANATETDKVQNLNTEELSMLGTGTGVDLGFMYRGEGRTPLSWGLTIQDVGNTKLVPDEATNLSKGERPLKDIEQTVNFGVAIEPGTKHSNFKLLADIRDIFNATNQDIYKKLHFGVELTFRELIGFTAGLNQGYGSYGAYIDIRFLRIDIGGYTEEVGEYAGSRPDQRLYFKIAASL